MTDYCKICGNELSEDRKIDICEECELILLHNKFEGECCKEGKNTWYQY